MAEEKIVVPSDKKEVSKKVAVELEVDTSIKDLGPNPYARIIHMARAVDSWRIFPRIFITTYICLLYTSPSPRDLSTSRMPSSA